MVLLGMLSSDRDNLPVLLHYVPHVLRAMTAHAGNDRIERAGLDVLEHVVVVGCVWAGSQWRLMAL
jgi:hypothetical protein